jgi:hypothetical protein
MQESIPARHIYCAKRLLGDLERRRVGALQNMLYWLSLPLNPEFSDVNVKFDIRKKAKRLGQLGPALDFMGYAMFRVLGSN